MAAWLLSSSEWPAKAIRFIVVGVLSGTIYAGVTALLVSFAGMAAVVASLIGYCVSVPTSFLGHRRFSFRSNGHLTTEAIRFAVMQAINLTVTAGAMQAAVGILRVPYYWGMVATVILLPIANFATSARWARSSKVWKMTIL